MSEHIDYLKPKGECGCGCGLFGRWDLFRTGEFGRFVTSVKTLHEAEEYVLADSCPDQVEESA